MNGIDRITKASSDVYSSHWSGWKSAGRRRSAAAATTAQSHGSFRSLAGAKRHVA